MTNPFNNGTEENTTAEVSTDADVVADEPTEAQTGESEETPDIIVSESQTDSALQEKYDTLNSQYIRLAADFDNYRKRQAQERESLLKYGAENTLKLLKYWTILNAVKKQTNRLMIVIN